MSTPSFSDSTPSLYGMYAAGTAPPQEAPPPSMPEADPEKLSKIE